MSLLFQQRFVHKSTTGTASQYFQGLVFIANSVSMSGQVKNWGLRCEKWIVSVYFKVIALPKFT